MTKHKEPNEIFRRDAAGHDLDISSYSDLVSAVVEIVVEDIKRNGQIALALKNSLLLSSPNLQVQSGIQQQEPRH